MSWTRATEEDAALQSSLEALTHTVGHIENRFKVCIRCPAIFADSEDIRQNVNLPDKAGIAKRLADVAQAATMDESKQWSKVEEKHFKDGIAKLAEVLLVISKEPQTIKHIRKTGDNWGEIKMSPTSTLNFLNDYACRDVLNVTKVYNSPDLHIRPPRPPQTKQKQLKGKGKGGGKALHNHGIPLSGPNSLPVSALDNQAGVEVVLTSRRDAERRAKRDSRTRHGRDISTISEGCTDNVTTYGGVSGSGRGGAGRIQLKRRRSASRDGRQTGRTHDSRPRRDSRYRAKRRKRSGYEAGGQGRGTSARDESPHDQKPSRNSSLRAPAETNAQAAVPVPAPRLTTEDVTRLIKRFTQEEDGFVDSLQLAIQLQRKLRKTGCSEKRCSLACTAISMGLANNRKDLDRCIELCIENAYKEESSSSANQTSSATKSQQSACGSSQPVAASGSEQTSQRSESTGANAGLGGAAENPTPVAGSSSSSNYGVAESSGEGEADDGTAKSTGMPEEGTVGVKEELVAAERNVTNERSADGRSSDAAAPSAVFPSSTAATANQVPLSGSGGQVVRSKPPQETIAHARQGTGPGGAVRVEDVQKVFDDLAGRDNALITVPLANLLWSREMLSFGDALKIAAEVEKASASKVGCREWIEAAVDVANGDKIFTKDGHIADRPAEAGFQRSSEEAPPHVPMLNPFQATQATAMAVAIEEARTSSRTGTGPGGVYTRADLQAVVDNCGGRPCTSEVLGFLRSTGKVAEADAAVFAGAICRAAASNIGLADLISKAVDLANGTGVSDTAPAAVNAEPDLHQCGERHNPSSASQVAMPPPKLKHAAGNQYAQPGPAASPSPATTLEAQGHEEAFPQSPRAPDDPVSAQAPTGGHKDIVPERGSSSSGESDDSDSDSGDSESKDAVQTKQCSSVVGVRSSDDRGNLARSSEVKPRSPQARNPKSSRCRSRSRRSATSRRKGDHIKRQSSRKRTNGHQGDDNDNRGKSRHSRSRDPSERRKPSRARIRSPHGSRRSGSNDSRRKEKSVSRQGRRYNGRRNRRNQNWGNRNWHNRSADFGRAGNRNRSHHGVWRK
ncbi:unnamed protein product [Amoebophrya sp. A120]|nr:unnamed protein product [Amoebophrya sp. A120]|eukprot:GSA120T00003546001.1